MLSNAMPNLKFGRSLSLDIGASGVGSSKFQELDDSGKPKGKSHNFPLRPVKDGDDFVLAVAENAKKIPGASSNLEPYKVIVANLPGQTTKPGLMAAFINMKTTDGKMVSHIDFNKLGGLVGSPNARLISQNDVVGGIAEAINQIAQKHPERFRAGEKVTYAVTGGGLGILDGEIGKKSLRISSSEGGNVRDYTRGGQALEVSRVSVTALKKNFLSHLKSSMNAPMPDAGPLPGQIVTQYKEAKKLFPELTRQQYHTAANHAINEYMDGLAMAFQGRIHAGTTLAVVTGPVAEGVKHYMNKYPEQFKSDAHAYDQKFPGHEKRPLFEKVFLNRTYEAVSDGVKILYKARKFDVLTDVHIADNTVGAKHLLKGKEGDRGDSYKVPLSAFKAHI